MPIFICAKCKCLENTALTPSYWANLSEPDRQICSECSTGKWHKRFKKEKYNPKKHTLKDGFVE